LSSFSRHFPRVHLSSVNVCFGVVFRNTPGLEELFTVTALTQTSICFVEFGRQIDCCSIWRRIVAVWWRFSGSLLEALDKVCYICLWFLYITFFSIVELVYFGFIFRYTYFFSWNLMCISNHYQQVFIFFEYSTNRKSDTYLASFKHTDYAFIF
jgi:hypothetical protein